MQTLFVTRTGAGLIITVAFLLAALVIYANNINKHHRFKFHSTISSSRIGTTLSPVEARNLEKRLMGLDGVYKVTYNCNSNVVVFIYDPTILSYSTIHHEINLRKASSTLQVQNNHKEM